MSKTKKLLLNSKTRRLLKSKADKPNHCIILSGRNSFDAEQAAGFYIENLSAKKPKAYQSIPYDGKLIGIEDVRTLKKTTSMRPSHDSLTVIYIKNFDVLSTESQNAMLKLIEEPSEGILYVLSIGLGIEGIIPTIVSRSATVEALPPQINDLKEYFPEVDGSTIDKAIQLARGETSIILNYIRGEDQELKLAKSILAGDKFSRLKLASQIDKDRELATTVVKYIRNIMLHLLEESVVSLKKERDNVNLHRYRVSVDNSIRALEALSANSNVKLTLDNLFVHL